MKKIICNTVSVIGCSLFVGGVFGACIDLLTTGESFVLTMVSLGALVVAQILEK